MQTKVAVFGDKDFCLPFSALGMDIYPAKESEGLIAIALWSGNVFYDCWKQFRNSLSRLCRSRNNFFGIDIKDIFHLLCYTIHISVW